MNRREIIAGLGAAAAWPLTTRGQQTAVPTIGLLHPASPEAAEVVVTPFRSGLREAGFIEGRNVSIEYRYGQNHMDALSGLAGELAQSRVAVIFARGLPAVRAAIAATATIPIVFDIGEDPVKEGLVPSLNRVGGNVTGFSDFSNQLAGKRVGLMHDTIPAASIFGALVNSSNPNAGPDITDVQSAADLLGRQLRIFKANAVSDLEPAFADMARQRIEALFVNIDFLFAAQSEYIARLAARYAIPAFYSQRLFVAAGGLMSYGIDSSEVGRQAGGYVGRILKGERTSDLPVQEGAKFNLVINLKAAKILGLDIPAGVLAQADEVIE